ncbi:hypothetical protein STEG23_038215, partial [Scotinomys teguina]
GAAGSAVAAAAAEEVKALNAPATTRAQAAVAAESLQSCAQAAGILQRATPLLLSPCPP